MEEAMGLMEMTELLKQNPLFSGLDDSGLQKVKGIAALHSFKK